MAIATGVVLESDLTFLDVNRASRQSFFVGKPRRDLLCHSGNSDQPRLMIVVGAGINREHEIKSLEKKKKRVLAKESKTRGPLGRYQDLP